MRERANERRMNEREITAVVNIYFYKYFRSSLSYITTELCTLLPKPSTHTHPSQLSACHQHTPIPGRKITSDRSRPLVLM